MAKLATGRLASLAVLASAGLLAGCQPLLSIPAVQRGVAFVTGDPQPADPPDPASSGGSEYASWLEPGHPLASGITSAEHGAVDLHGLVAAARQHDVVWIGVEPENPQAYRFAARYLRALAKVGAAPRLVVAAVPSEQQARLRSTYPGNARQRAWALSDSLPWQSYGADDPEVMPAMIEPVFRAALESRFDLVAGGYPRAKLRAFALEGAALRRSQEASSIGLDIDWHGTRNQSLAAALQEEQCARIPEPLAESRVLVDRVESGGVAARVADLLGSRRGRPAVVVVTELRHGRTDVGAPHTLAALSARRRLSVKQFSVGIQEADWARAEVSQYRQEIAEHDAVWFTEPIYDDPELADTCARASLKAATALVAAQAARQDPAADLAHSTGPSWSPP